jgi:hypothetical protein
MVIIEKRRGVWLSMVSLLIRCLLFAIFALVMCMDPDAYKPDEPPAKIDPPDAPTIILPVQDTVVRSEYSCYVTLDWTGVEGAEGYEFQVDRDSNFSASFPYQGQFPPISFYAVCFPPVTTYYFRTRAYSDLWIWYTAWSEVRRFHLMPVEDDTIFHPD